ncbi:MAG TPA: glycoside hydrolase family 3 N-terminal domain-containing protein, partial [Lacipirellulaceae bacterium]|nr:glycoside hydrolase family 3 N-terminal domain-containing protein [Lacipirellulaceae bacterium]
GQAASWNPELVEKAAAVAAREARSVGVDWTFAPMVDIARDPRWGRIAESLGEDPFLASRLSAAMVRGFQGSNLSASDRIAACAKHFAGYGACEGGRDYNSAEISPSLMRNVYLPPFHAAVDAGVATLMTSFNAVNGVPGSANKHLLREVLRNEWEFRGFVVSDWESIREMIAHGYCRNEKEAALAAVRAGVNMEMVSHTYRDSLPSLIKNGELSEASLDSLVAGVLRVKLLLGLFEHPYVENLHPEFLQADDLQIARQLATQSVVLLKNERNILPLNKSKLRRLAVIGPLADAKRDQLGTWAADGRPSDSRTPRGALRESAPPGLEVLFAPGLSDDLDEKTSAFSEAVAAARKADVVLLFVGEGADLSGEARSRAMLDLPGAQSALVDAIAATGKPIVLIVEAGRPLTIAPHIAKVNAVLYSFHAGTMAGPALADLIWGIESPSGKLPVTFPKVVGQIPLYYNHMSTGRPPRPYEFPQDSAIDERIHLDLGNNSNYIDIGPYPLFPFGYGLSYTTFQYGHAELSTTELRPGETVTVQIPVTNTGKRLGTAVVQLYIRDATSEMVRPVRELKGFQRIPIAPGETKIARFRLSRNSFTYFDVHERKVVPPGRFDIYIGGDSTAPKVGELAVDK